MGKAKNFQAPCKGSPLLAPWAISASVDLILPAKEEKSQSSLRLKYRSHAYTPFQPRPSTAFFYKFSGLEQQIFTPVNCFLHLQKPWKLLGPGGRLYGQKSTCLSPAGTSLDFCPCFLPEFRLLEFPASKPAKRMTGAKSCHLPPAKSYLRKKAPWAISTSADLILPAKEEKSQSSLRLKYRSHAYTPFQPRPSTAFFYKFSGLEQQIFTPVNCFLHLQKPWKLLGPGGRLYGQKSTCLSPAGTSLDFCPCFLPEFRLLEFPASKPAKRMTGAKSCHLPPAKSYLRKKAAAKQLSFAAALNLLRTFNEPASC